MQNHKSFKQRTTDWLFDHEPVKNGLTLAWTLLVLTFSAFMFAFGYKAFLNPTSIVHPADPNIEPGFRIVSGGASGLSQTFIVAIYLIGKCFNGGTPIVINEDLIYSIIYFALNVPVILLAFFGIGKRFALCTLYNVGMATLFTNILSLDAFAPFLTAISQFTNQNGGMLARAIFAGVCTGISSGVAYKVDSSAGGIDVIAYYIALKKNVLVGKYSIAINIGIIVSFTILTAANENFGENGVFALAVALYSVVYMLVTGAIVDLINRRNKKCQIEVVTDNPELGKILIANIPHAATIIKGEGAFSGKEHYIVQIVISFYEVKKTVQIIRESDPRAFIKVMDLHQVYGRFFLMPIR